MEFSELVFRYLDRGAKVKDYIDWAMELLYEGSDSQNIAILASYCLEKNPDAEEVEKYFKLCVLDMGWKLPSRGNEDDWYQALLDYTSGICAQMITGKRGINDGVCELLNLAEDNNDPYILTIWIDLLRDLNENSQPINEENVSFNSSLNLSNYEECIRLTAHQYVSLCSRVLPEKFPRVWICRRCNYVPDRCTWTTTVASDCPNCGGVSSLKNMRHSVNRDFHIGFQNA